MIAQLQRAVQIKRQIAELSAELAGINQKIVAAAEFKPGSNTWHLMADNVKATVRNNPPRITWNQEAMPLIMEHFAFAGEVFKTEITHRSKKALDAAIANDPEFKKAVEYAGTFKPVAPTVTYDILEEKYA